MQLRQIAFDAIGTHWNIQVVGALNDEVWEETTAAIMARIEQFDATYSRFREDSFVTRLSKHAGTYELPSDAAPLLRLYRQLYDVTDGRVTPLIGQTMVDAGYDASYSFIQKPLTAPPRWDDVLFVDDTTIRLQTPALLDFGAAGKGYLVDIISEVLANHGATRYMIDAGGDILHRNPDSEPTQIGLENPHDISEAIGIVRLANRSLCASASTKRAWNTMHHIIDPHDLKPTSDIVATWVIADTTIAADGLATALFFVSPATLGKQFSFDYALLKENGECTYSKHFPATIFEAAHA